MPLIEDLSRYGIEDCSYSPEAQKINAYSIALSPYSNSKILRDVKIPASKPCLLACRSSNCKDALYSMKTKLFAMQKIDFLPDTRLKVLRTQMPEQNPAESRSLPLCRRHYTFYGIQVPAKKPKTKGKVGIRKFGDERRNNDQDFHQDQVSHRRFVDRTSCSTRAFGDHHVILKHGQVTWTTPEFAPHLLTTTPHQREDVSALDRFYVHRCPIRRVFSGTGLELVTRQATSDTCTTRLPWPRVDW
ncbi:uncharacterized protein TNCV_298741 [Trichonephila clavipes]|nr:uncharacterized protein TNCV_298741 [Trichonephila clavipes]